MMASYGLFLVVLLSLTYFNTVSTVQGEALNSMEILEKPQRPRVFTSPEDLKIYLGALGRYYATAGRNRYLSINLLSTDSRLYSNREIALVAYNVKYIIP